MSDHMRDEYVVSICFEDGTLQQHRAVGLREAKEHFTAVVQRLLNSDGVDDDGEFGGSFSWYVEQVPATPFDQIVADATENAHGIALLPGAGIKITIEDAVEYWSLDRDDRYIMREENVRGGYWLTSSDSVDSLVETHYCNEYAEEWEIEEIFDTTTGEAVNFEVEHKVVIR